MVVESDKFVDPYVNPNEYTIALPRTYDGVTKVTLVSASMPSTRVLEIVSTDDDLSELAGVPVPYYVQNAAVTFVGIVWKAAPSGSSGGRFWVYEIINTAAFATPNLTSLDLTFTDGGDVSVGAFQCSIRELYTPLYMRVDIVEPSATALRVVEVNAPHPPWWEPFTAYAVGDIVRRGHIAEGGSSAYAFTPMRCTAKHTSTQAYGDDSGNWTVHTDPRPDCAGRNRMDGAFGVIPAVHTTAPRSDYPETATPLASWAYRGGGAGADISMHRIKVTFVDKDNRVHQFPMLPTIGHADRWRHEPHRFTLDIEARGATVLSHGYDSTAPF